jgi:hypothetical protein
MQWSSTLLQLLNDFVQLLVYNVKAAPRSEEAEAD